jgi:hypothetical protein
MFDTIVDKVTGHFNKNTLVSAVFPNLIFWGITAAVIMIQRIGFFDIEMGWTLYDGLSLVSQILILIVILIWILFWSYITITIQPTLVLLYEGYWSDIQPIKTLKEIMCSSWERRWKQKNDRDIDLEKIRIENEIKKEGANRSDELLEIFKKIDEINEERLKIQQELFYRYPEKQDSNNPTRFYPVLMPTEFGNILKAAELYSLNRYHLDTVLIWPKLVPLLPENFIDYFQHSETSLVLMITLSAFSLLFGIPISVMIGCTSPTWLIWWIPLIVFVTSFVSRLYLTSTLALISLLTELIYNVGYVKDWTLQIHILSILFAVTFLISKLAYVVAVNRAFDYGDKIRAAIDLYRFKILEGLNLQLPSTLSEERKIWDQVNGLLYRNYEVNPLYYRYAKKRH